jgi:mannose-6-phosphate isomerase-like protein (cupin superfamily)
MILGAGFAVVEANETTAQALPNDGGTVRTTIDGASGCHNLVQRLIGYRRRADVGATPGSVEVGYVVSGAGSLATGGRTLPLAPGSGFLVPPGVPAIIEPTGTTMTVVSVVCPPPGRPSAADPDPPGECAVVREADREPLPAGESRYFKLLVDPSVGCRGVTQFVGFIEKSRAPEHVHTYEEVIYILDGNGTLHVGDARLPFERGSSIFLSPGTPHCLENGAAGTLRLLGVFSPSGSPADKAQ